MPVCDQLRSFVCRNRNQGIMSGRQGGGGPPAHGQAEEKEIQCVSFCLKSPDCHTEKMNIGQQGMEDGPRKCRTLLKEFKLFCSAV